MQILDHLLTQKIYLVLDRTVVCQDLRPIQTGHSQSFETELYSDKKKKRKKEKKKNPLNILLSLSLVFGYILKLKSQ